MFKDEKIVLGLLGGSILGLGVIIGGVVVSKIDDKFHSDSTKRWNDLTDTLKELLEKSWEKNDELKKIVNDK